MRLDEKEDRQLVRVPRCLHGATWNRCVLCARTTWCEDCGDRVVLDDNEHLVLDKPDPLLNVTCASCVEQMIAVRAVMVDGRYVSRRRQRILELVQRGAEARERR